MKEVTAREHNEKEVIFNVLCKCCIKRYWGGCEGIAFSENRKVRACRYALEHYRSVVNGCKI